MVSERDEIALQRDRLADQLISRVGYEPVSTPIRQEMIAAVKKIEEDLNVLYEDSGSGMIAEEVLAMADELGAPV